MRQTLDRHLKSIPSSVLWLISLNSQRIFVLQQVVHCIWVTVTQHTNEQDKHCYNQNNEDRMSFQLIPKMLPKA